MSGLKIVRELFTIGFGVLGIALVAMGSEWYYGLLGVGLIAWGSYDIYQEVRDSNSGSSVALGAVEREEIRRNLGE